MINLLKYLTWLVVRNSKDPKEVECSDSCRLAKYLTYCDFKPNVDAYYMDKSVEETVAKQFGLRLSQRALSYKGSMCGFLEYMSASDFEGDTIIIEKKEK